LAGFNWNRGAEKNLAKRLYRKQRQLATNHPDEKIKCLEDCKKQNNKDPLLKHCEDKIVKEWEQYQRKVVVPETEKAPRFNRL